jgi:hypothetical protein
MRVLLKIYRIIPIRLFTFTKKDVSNIKSILFDYDYSGIRLANSMAIDLSRLVLLCKINYFTTTTTTQFNLLYTIFTF